MPRFGRSFGATCNITRKFGTSVCKTISSDGKPFIYSQNYSEEPFLLVTSCSLRSTYYNIYSMCEVTKCDIRFIPAKILKPLKSQTGGTFFLRKSEE